MYHSEQYKCRFHTPGNCYFLNPEKTPTKQGALTSSVLAPCSTSRLPLSLGKVLLPSLWSVQSQLAVHDVQDIAATPAFTNLSALLDEDWGPAHAPVQYAVVEPRRGRAGPSGRWHSKPTVSSRRGVGCAWCVGPPLHPGVVPGPARTLTDAALRWRNLGGTVSGSVAVPAGVGASPFPAVFCFTGVCSPSDAR